MAPGPIRFAEIDAYCRTMLDPLDLWDKLLIRRMDAAWLKARAGGAASPNDPDPSDRSAPVTDRKAVRGVLAGIGERMRATRRG